MSDQSRSSLQDVLDRIFVVCDLMKVLKDIDADEGDFSRGHEQIIKIMDEKLQGIFDPIADIQKALGIEGALYDDKEDSGQESLEREGCTCAVSETVRVETPKCPEHGEVRHV